MVIFCQTKVFKFIATALFSVLNVLIAQPSWAIEPYTLTIEAEFHLFFTISGKGKQTLTRLDEQCWQIEVKSKARLANQHDQGQFCIIDNLIVPKSTLSSNKVTWEEFEVSGDFDSETNQWHLNKNGSDIVVGNDAPSFDNMTMQIAISEAINRGEKNIIINNMDSHKIKTVEYEVRQDEYLRTDFGRVLTKKLIQRQGQAENQRNYMWVTEHKGMWLPVVIKRYEDNKLKYQIDTVKIQ